MLVNWSTCTAVHNKEEREKEKEQERERERERYLK
jgi:hypothetical protein